MPPICFASRVPSKQQRPGNFIRRTGKRGEQTSQSFEHSERSRSVTDVLQLSIRSSDPSTLSKALKDKAIEATEERSYWFAKCAFIRILRPFPQIFQRTTATFSIERTGLIPPQLSRSSHNPNRLPNQSNVVTHTATSSLLQTTHLEQHPHPALAGIIAFSPFVTSTPAQRQVFSFHLAAGARGHNIERRGNRKRTKYIYKNRLPSRIAGEPASSEAALLGPALRVEAFWGWVRRSSIDSHSETNGRR
jgi:hypothetical protein